MPHESKINGSQIAAEIAARLKESPKPSKSLIAILVGDSDASKSFIAQKAKFAESLGINFLVKTIPSVSELESSIQKIAADPQVGGIILQLPLPDGAPPEKFIAQIPRNLDVDALGTEATVLPPAVEVVKEILKREKILLKEKNVVIMGKGRLTGQPIASWLTGKCGSLKVIDKGEDRSSIAEADIIVTGVGSSGVIQSSILKEGAGVIDFGYSTENKKVVGDLSVDSDPIKLAFYTPTPGGTGPILVAKLFENFYKLCTSG